MPALYCNECYEQDVHHPYRQQVFPFQVQQLVDPQSGEGPAEPHDEEDEQEGLPQKPHARRNVIHDLVEFTPLPDVKGHPSAEEYGSCDGGHDEHVHVLGKEEEGELDTGVFGMKARS